MNGQQTDDGKVIDRQWEANKAEADGRRPAEAEARGGWIYTVGLHQSPIMVAQHFGGRRPGVLLELLAVNPRMDHGPCDVCVPCAAMVKEERSEVTCAAPMLRWDRRRWFVGAGVLLPLSWGDPRLKSPLSIERPATAGMRAKIAASTKEAQAKRARKPGAISGK